MKTDDIYQDMLVDSDDKYDCSEYPSLHILFSLKNKKGLGCWKDEHSDGTPIREFVGLRSKMCSVLSDISSKVKAKGIVKPYIKHKLKHDMYVDALRRKKMTDVTFRQFKSSNHVVKTIEVKKFCLSSFDCKHYVLENGEQMLAFGHYSLV